MEISILFLGDIVGHPGREAVREILPDLIKEFKPDLVLANAENATHGRGLQPKHYEELKALGIDCMTLGDHAWDQSDLLSILDSPETTIVRPANFADAPGKGYRDITVKGMRLRLISLLGRVFTGANVDNPFHTVDKVLNELPVADFAVIDMHAEATSEKRMLAEHLDGRVQLVVGTHTHVPTADAQILEHGTAFISDMGMVGPQNSSLGADKSEVLRSFLTGLPWRYTVGAGQCELGAIFCTFDSETKRATHIEHIRRFTHEHA